MPPIRPENRKRYPAEWPAIVAQVRERSGGRCECRGECGREPGHLGPDGRCVNVDRSLAWKTGAVVILTTAHRDHVPEHCALDNLFHGCQGCHLAYDREHHAQTRTATRRAGKALGDLF